jgi:acylphosphatase
MRAKRVVIAGAVQGVGFRMWMVKSALELGLSGWVRNRRDGTIEALISGDPAAVEELLRACRLGPRAARVDEILEFLADPPEEPGFTARATI